MYTFYHSPLSHNQSQITAVVTIIAHIAFRLPFRTNHQSLTNHHNNGDQLCLYGIPSPLSYKSPITHNSSQKWSTPLPLYHSISTLSSITYHSPVIIAVVTSYAPKGFSLFSHINHQSLTITAVLTRYALIAFHLYSLINH